MSLDEKIEGILEQLKYGVEGENALVGLTSKSPVDAIRKIDSLHDNTGKAIKALIKEYALQCVPEKDDIADTEPRMPRTVYAEGYNRAIGEMISNVEKL